MNCLTGIKYDDFFVGNAIGAFARALSDKINDAVTSATNLSCSACYAIVQIGSEPDSPIEELRRMLNLEHSSVVRLLDRLQNQGLVIRARGHSRDMRQVSINLTDLGEEYFTKILDARRDVLNKMVGNLDLEEKTTFIKLVTKIASSVVEPGDDQHVVCRLCDLEKCPQEICPMNLAYPEHFELPEQPFKRVHTPA